MKIPIILFFVILCAAFVSAQGVDVVKDTYIAGETVQAYVNKTDFSLSKLQFVDSGGDKINVGFLTYDFGDDSYFVYFDLPSTLSSGTFKLQYKVRGWVDGLLTDIIDEDAFTIIAGTSAISMKPAILTLKENDNTFSIKLTNHGTVAADVNVSSADNAIIPARKSINVPAGEVRTVFADYDFDSVKGDTALGLGYGSRSFSIPIIKPSVETLPEENKTVPENKSVPVVNRTVPANKTPVVLQPALKFVPDLNNVSHKVAVDTVINGSFGIMNTLSTPIHNVTLSTTASLAGLVDFNVSSFSVIKPKEKKYVYIWINRFRSASAGSYSGSIVVGSAEASQLKMGLDLGFEEVEVVVLGNKTPIITVPSGLNVSDIDENLTVDVDVNVTLGEEKKEGKYGTALVIIIIVIFLIIGYLAYRLRPQPLQKRFDAYVGQFKRGAQKKKRF
jgi:hypothetical protein